MNIKTLITVGLFLFIQGCSTAYTYNYSSIKAFEPKGGEFLYIIPNPGEIVATQNKPFIENYLIQNGFKITDNIKKAKYAVYFSTGANAWQTQRSVPIWGKTGIRSINTTTNAYSNTNFYGNYDSNSYYTDNYMNTYGSFNGYSDTNSFANSNTSIKYDYGITGYSNVIDDHFLRIFSLGIIEIKNKTLVYQTYVTTNYQCNENEFMEFVRKIYAKNPLMNSLNTEYQCYVDSDRLCEEGKESKIAENIMMGLMGGIAGGAAALSH